MAAPVKYIELTDRYSGLRGPPRDAGLFRIPALSLPWVVLFDHFDVWNLMFHYTIGIPYCSAELLSAG
eukprot:COSAG02_NODE_1924_length_10351_cov_4.487320_9_plen_68_part_00